MGSIATAAVATGPIARAASTRGVTPTTLKIGNTMPYSGSGSAYSNVGKAESAFFGGRRIEFLSYHDASSPPKTVERVRRLVEQDEVDFRSARFISVSGFSSNRSTRSWRADSRNCQMAAKGL